MFCGSTVKSVLAAKVLPMRTTPMVRMRLYSSALTVATFGLLAVSFGRKSGSVPPLAANAAWIFPTLIVKPCSGW